MRDKDLLGVLAEEAWFKDERRRLCELHVNAFAEAHYQLEQDTERYLKDTRTLLNAVTRGPGKTRNFVLVSSRIAVLVAEIKATVSKFHLRTLNYLAPRDDWLQDADKTTQQAYEQLRNGVVNIAIPELQRCMEALNTALQQCQNKRSSA